MLKEIKNLLSFLTAIPISMDKDCLTDSAKGMFLFPLIGAFIGLLAGAFAWATSLILPSLVVGALALGALLLLTGLHHTDERSLPARPLPDTGYLPPEPRTLPLRTHTLPHGTRHGTQ